MRTESTRTWLNLCRLGLLAGFVALAYGSAVTASAAAASALKIGLLMDYSTGNEEAVRNRQRAFELAIKHVNQGGGVLGRPVEFAIGDSTSNPEKAVTEALRLVEAEGVHAIVGPNSSANALPVAERVIGPAGIPAITFSATSPRLTAAADRDFLFRTALSDVAQGPVLARITRERGVDNVGLLHVDDAWGRGLAGAFKAAWEGRVKTVAFDRQRTGFVDALRESASEGAQALVVIAFATAAEKIVREATEHGIYRTFTFGDSAKRGGPGPVVGRRPARGHVRQWRRNRHLRGDGFVTGVGTRPTCRRAWRIARSGLCPGGLRCNGRAGVGGAGGA